MAFKLVYNDLEIHITVDKDIIFGLFKDCINDCFISIKLVFTKANKGGVSWQNMKSG